MPRHSAARRRTDAHSTLQAMKLLASFRRDGEKQWRGLGPASSQCLGRELGQALLEQAENRGDAPSPLEHRHHGPDPSSSAACAKHLPAAWWQVQVLSDCTVALDKLLN